MRHFRPNTISQRVAASFAGNLYLSFYIPGKLAADPIYSFAARQLTAEKVSDQGILDIGCGVGLFAAYLREAGAGTPYLGIDPAEKKIRTAKRYLVPAYRNLDFQTGEGRKLPDFSGNVVAFDILQYFSDEEQITLLSDMLDRLAPNGLLILRTTLHEKHWRYAITNIEEACIRSCGWIRGGLWNFPKRTTIEKALAGKARFVALPTWEKTPFYSWIFLVRKMA
ncbi:MAG: class I SAM-dependent methyltransferase [Chthoniobacterales bacterium]